MMSNVLRVVFQKVVKMCKKVDILPIILFVPLKNVCIFLSYRYTLSNLDTSLEGASEDMTVVDAASLRRQVSNILQLL